MATADLDPTYYLHERYAPTRDRSPLLSLFYAAKPALPRGAQLALRRAYARRQARRRFPAWPEEPILVEHLHDQLRRRLRERADGRVPLVGFWPHGHRHAAILTHDVEGPEGIERIPRLLEVERRHGFVSSWNFCAEWYEIPPGLFETLRGAGCEVGLHGIRHDGRLFSSRETFMAELPKIHRYLAEWGAVGFRSPATHRNAPWMHELGCLYDSSFPDTEPFGPQPGGCCSILPFLFGDVVELPITLAQDQTLWEILRVDDIELWRRKARWVAERNGLITVIVHPDYVDSPRRLAAYEELLVFLREELDGGWHALAREVAAWWRRRERLRVRESPGGEAVVEGGPPFGASVAWACEREGGIVLEPDDPSPLPS